MIGYIVAALIGISLGLIGGGGSILTMPVLVYLFNISPVLATSYSLFIVGSTSLVGSIINYRKGYVNIKTALLFGLSSVLTVFAIRKFLIPKIPLHIVSIAGFEVTTPLLTMLLFATLMIVAATSMIRNRTIVYKKLDYPGKSKVLKLLFLGICIGMVTGLLGAGGGFLLIPVLVLLLHQPMKTAIGTSLLIIATNSLLGFTGDLNNFKMDWTLLLTVSGISAAGMFIGVLLSQKIKGELLKKTFGWFVLLMGSYIIVKELFFK